jgi:hypothetical protein
MYHVISILCVHCMRFVESTCTNQIIFLPRIIADYTTIYVQYGSPTAGRGQLGTLGRVLVSPREFQNNNFVYYVRLENGPLESNVN